MVDRTSLTEALELLTDGPLLNRIDRHNADEFVKSVAIVCEAAREHLSRCSEVAR